MIISPSKEFIFVHLEKCGGTSVESALEPHLEWSDLIIGSTDFGEGIQNLYFNRFGTQKVKNKMLWKHSSAKDIYYFIGSDQWNSFKKFSVVRDPIDLVKSLYNFSQTIVKYHLGRINRESWKEKLRVNKLYDSFPFSEGYVIAYIDCVIEGSGIDGFTEKIINSKYSFIQPQTNRLSVNSIINLGNIVDLSMLNEKWDSITDQMGFDHEIKLSHLNSSEESNEELSLRSIKKIKKHFSIDYQILPKYTGVYWN